MLAEEKTVFKINLLFTRCVGGGVGGNKQTCAGCNFPQFASFEFPLGEKQVVEVKGTDCLERARPVCSVTKPVFIGRSTGL